MNFDQKFGPDFLKTVPATSGIYLFRNADAVVIYVGKAKNLKRRLAQYRLLKPSRKNLRMRRMLKHATALEYRLCESETSALLLENELIQSLKPEFNVAGAYAFLYPYLGIKREPSGWLSLCHTTDGHELEGLGFELYGAFRNRLLVQEAFEALKILLPYFGHADNSRRKDYGELPFTGLVSFRQIDAIWDERLKAFFRGIDEDLLATFLLELLEKSSARQNSEEIGEQLKTLRRFFREESQKLRRVLDAQGHERSRIDQSERDPLFIRSKVF